MFLSGQLLHWNKTSPCSAGANILAPEDSVTESRDIAEVDFCSRLEQAHHSTGSTSCGAGSGGRRAASHSHQQQFASFTAAVHGTFWSHGGWGGAGGRRQTVLSAKCAGRPRLKVQEPWVTQDGHNERYFSLLQSVILSASWRDGLLSLRGTTSQVPPVFTCPSVSELTPVITAGDFPSLCIQTCDFAVWSGRPTPRAASMTTPSLFPTCPCAHFCFSLCFGDYLLSQLLCPLKHFPLLTLLISVSPKFPSLLIFTPHRLLDLCLLHAGTSSS